jgi:type VI secretion system protein ImpE
MTVADLLRNGDLSAALVQQDRRVQDHPRDAAARLLLMELHAVAGELNAAARHLAAITSDDPTWRKSRKHFYRLLKLLSQRRRWEPPKFLGEPPAHVLQRRRLARAVRREATSAALQALDRADAVSPHLTGHLNGREFEALRDVDDRTASVLEAFIAGELVWIAWDELRRVTLAPAVNVLDRVVRAATLRLRGGDELAAFLPMTYAAWYDRPDEDALALGLDTDRGEEHGGVIIARGGKLLLTQDEEVLLGELRQIDIR